MAEKASGISFISSNSISIAGQSERYIFAGGSNLKNISAVIDFFEKEFNWPKKHGRNFDAFWDIMAFPTDFGSADTKIFITNAKSFLIDEQTAVIQAFLRLMYDIHDRWLEPETGEFNNNPLHGSIKFELILLDQDKPSHIFDASIRENIVIKSLVAFNEFQTN